MKALLALALLAALVAGCSGSSPAGPVTPQKDTAGHYVIHMMTSNLFSPKDAAVPAGSNVTWVHDGGAAHNVVDMGGSFTSDDLGHPITAGQSYTHKFDTAGVYHYHCAFHTGMEATLTVA